MVVDAKNKIEYHSPDGKKYSQQQICKGFGRTSGIQNNADTNKYQNDEIYNIKYQYRFHQASMNKKSDI